MLYMVGALLVLVPLQIGGCQEEGVSPHEADCSDYCDVILECDATQFYDHFPSLEQCNVACSFALSGQEPGFTPACVDAKADTVACVGSLTCTQFYNAPCASEYAAQETVCATD